MFGYIAFRSSEPPGTPATITPSAYAGSPASQADLVAQGKTLFNQYRCNVCHTTTGGRAAGPTLKGLAGSQVKLEGGQTVVADAKYLRQSILDPDSQIVAGYGPSVMSAATAPFLDQISQVDHVNALVAYIQSLK